MNSEVCCIALETLHSIVESELQLYLNADSAEHDMDASRSHDTVAESRPLIDIENHVSLQRDLTLLSEKALCHSASALMMTVSQHYSDFYYKKIQSVHWQSIEPIWLRLYCLFQLCKLFVIYPRLGQMDNSVACREAYQALDWALLISGGSEWHWFIHDRIEELDELRQQSYSAATSPTMEDVDVLVGTVEADMLEMARACTVPSVQLSRVPCHTTAMDWLSFVDTRLPFVCERRFRFVAQAKWNSIHFWRRSFGERTVPVEIGAQYTHASWTMEHMTMNAFLDCFICHVRAHPLSDIGYIAQYELLDQLPILGSDLDLAEFESQAMMTCPARSLSRNAYKIWFGSKGTTSPLHYDPNHNFYVQLVGYKRWTLISPQYTAHLQAHTLDSFGKLRNTSQLDLGVASVRSHVGRVIGPDNLIDVTLGPGDMLFVPKGWWHYVCSESASLSLSTWF